jgi:hypothetical protein
MSFRLQRFKNNKNVLLMIRENIGARESHQILVMKLPVIAGEIR